MFFGDNIIVNLTLWNDIESLHDFVYRTAHAEIMSRRKEWFERMSQTYQVLWWVPAATIPTLEQAAARLDNLQSTGPSSKAFTFKKIFKPG